MCVYVEREREKKKKTIHTHTTCLYRSVCHLDNTAHRGLDIGDSGAWTCLHYDDTRHLFFFILCFFFFSLFWLGGCFQVVSFFVSLFFLRCVHVFDGKEFFNFGWNMVTRSNPLVSWLPSFSYYCIREDFFFFFCLLRLYLGVSDGWLCVYM